MIQSLSTVTDDRLQVSDETRARSCDCPRNYACLHAESRTCCSVKEAVGNAIFVEGNHSDPSSCPYRISFGTTHRLCTCPVRNEIYSRYGI